MRKLFYFNHRIIKYLFYFFFTLTLLFALTSSNLILGDNHITRIGTTAFTTIVLLILGVFMLTLYVSSGARNFFYWLFIKKRIVTASIFLSLAIAIQIIFVSLIHSGIGFDVSGVHQGMLMPKDVNIIGYFSVNTNNLGIFLFQQWFANIFHNTSWLFFDFVTLFLVDLSAAFNLGSIAIIDKTKVPFGMYIESLWLVMFPAIIVPYTDTWTIEFVAMYIFCYCVIFYSHLPKIIKVIASLGFGFALSGAYFIKPSGIIPAIAIVLIELLDLLKKRHKISTLIFTVLMCLSSIGSFHYMNQTIKNQSYIRVNYFRAKPMVHFINMGLSGDGGYNAKDSFKMVTLVNKKDRVNYSINSIHKRLRKMGPVGYLAFLLKKHGNNTSDGTFAWLRDGDFVPMQHSPSKHGFKGKLENFFYLYGNNVGDFRFIVQIWWCIWLGIIFFAWHDNQKFTQIMRLSLIGGFIFLLIFEGGRSRYLIQFLPAFVILATLNFSFTIKELKNLFRWA